MTRGGKRVSTMLRKRNPIMDSVLHLLQEEPPPVGQEEVDAVMACRDIRSPKHNYTWQKALGAIYPEFNNDGDVVSGGSSPRIWEKCGDMAAQQVWDGTVKWKMNSVEKRKRNL